jgi:opacity protein-like surface antigen
MIKSRLIVAIVLLFAVAGNASGESNLFGPSNRTGYWDFAIQTRYTGSKDYTGGNGSRLSLEDNLGWGFNAGYNINERLNVGVFAAWRSVDYRAHIVHPDLDRPFEFSGWMDTANLGLNTTVNVLKNRFTPYLTGGIGWALVDTNIPTVPDIDCWWDPWWGYICLESGANISDDAASYMLGAGLSWQVTESFFVRVGYEKSWIDLEGADNFDIVRLDLGFLNR